MLRLDLSYFYRLSMTFDSVRTLGSDVEINDVWFDLYAVRGALKGLFNETALTGCLRSSVGAGNELWRWLVHLTDERKWEDSFSAHDKAHLVGLMDKFEIVLTSELAVASTYIVSEKPPFSTVSLVESGEVLFPIDLAIKAPDAVDDMREAGKCLAFELTTACGFHTLRAVEAVLRRYWEAVTGNLPKPKQRNIGVYLHALTIAGCGDAKVIAALKQLKDLHRNVIFHPEETLNVEQAISLVGISRSVVGEMLKALPVVVPAPVLEPSPMELDTDHATELAAIAADSAADTARVSLGNEQA